MRIHAKVYTEGTKSSCMQDKLVAIVKGFFVWVPETLVRGNGKTTFAAHNDIIKLCAPDIDQHRVNVVRMVYR